MSDTSGLPNSDSEGVPAEEDPSRFVSGGSARDSQAEDTADNAGADNADADTGAQDEPDPTTGTAASTGTDGAEPPPAELDPAQNPSNPDLVDTTEAPD